MKEPTSKANASEPSPTAQQQSLNATKHLYIVATYELYTKNEAGNLELDEKATEQRPFQVITGFGIALDTFEEKVATLQKGETFEFTIPQDEAFGPYEEEHVITRDKSFFSINGHFDKRTIYPGAVVPLENADGNYFHGLVTKVTETTVTVDLNHPLAGKDLYFKGKVLETREATPQEIQGLINRMSSDHCCCGCEDCNDDCQDHEHHHHPHHDGECSCTHCH